MFGPRGRPLQVGDVIGSLKLARYCLLIYDGVSLMPYYFAPGGGIRSIVITMSVCLFVRLHNSKTTLIFVHDTGVRGSVSSDDVTIGYILPVLWMTSCFHIMVICQYKRR